MDKQLQKIYSKIQYHGKKFNLEPEKNNKQSCRVKKSRYLPINSTVSTPKKNNFSHSIFTHFYNFIPIHIKKWYQNDKTIPYIEISPHPASKVKKKCE